VVTRGGCDAAIAGEQRSVEDLSERNVNRIVRGECRTELPDARKEEIMRIAMERKVAKILKRFLPSLLSQRPVADIAAQDLGNFDVEEVRSVQRLGRGRDTLVDPKPGRRLKKPLDSGGGI
jgi:hypothetical protein